MATAADYPEHLKLQQRKQELGIDRIGEFLEWLHGRHYMIAEWCREDGVSLLVPIQQNIEQILAEYVGIDLKKISREKNDMLKEIRELQLPKAGA